MGKITKTNKKTTRIKAQRAQNKKALVPEVLSPDAEFPSQFTMDGTRHTEISDMKIEDYSQKIILKARGAFDPGKLRAEKNRGEKPFLAEGEKQIFALWHGIEALTTHNTLFVVLFLISIGEILNEISSTLKPRDFVRWRRETFHHKHERYLQQAQQLAKMGNFAKQLASMGKKRLLSLDRLRKIENLNNHKQLFDQHPLPKEVKENLVPIKTLKTNPIPDSTEDLDGDLLKEHVDAIITQHRLVSAGINFASFDQAFLLAKYNKDAIPIKMAEKIKKYLDARTTSKAREKLFDDFVMDKGKFPFDGRANSKSGASLNQILAEFVDYCEDKDFSDKDWIESQRNMIQESLLMDTYKYMRIIGRKFKIKLSGNNQSK
jgi:hypothetical protein